MTAWVDSVLGFWFDECAPDQWFTKDDRFDALIRERFSALHAELAARPVIEETDQALGSLATVIVFDQFSRNLYRGSPRAFATDARALEISIRAIARGDDRAFSVDQRQFLYLPFEHSEDIRMQERSLQLFGSLSEELLRYAKEHQEIIARFGRFPHRNAVLGRESTPEEIEFLRTHRGF